MSDMRARAKHIATIPAIALLIACVSAPAASAATERPLPPSDYTVHPDCAAATPGRASCMSLKLVPLTTAARAHTHPLAITRNGPAPAASAASGSFGLRPQDIHSVYSLPTSPGTTQTVAIVDAYNDPTAEADLNEYSKEFGLPSCTSASGCFKQVNQNGNTSPLPYPATLGELETGLTAKEPEAVEAEGWGIEISLDMEAVHATCQTCHIVLVEADDPSFVNLEAAEHAADVSGAGEISNSFGGPEIDESAVEEASSAFNHPGTVVTASAGDAGYLAWDSENFFETGYAEFPASSPHVVAVGGTRLSPPGAGGTYTGESIWNGRGAGGGGCSVVFEAQPWQRALSDWSSVGCGSGRADADISADADPYTGLAVFDSAAPQCENEAHVPHWCTIGGTSLSSPMIAAVFALAGGAGSIAYPAQSLYENKRANPADVHDVVSGSNGECSAYNPKTGLSLCSVVEEGASCKQHLICVAASGYDGPSGVGSPDGIAAFDPNGSSGSGGGTGAGGGGGGGSGSGQPPAQQPAPATPAAPPASTPPPAAPQLTAVALTVKALVALNRSRPRLSAVAFSFVSNVLQPVRATLSRRTRRHHHLRWSPVGAGTTILALAGHNSGHLAGRAVLRRGTYRLLLTPAHGTARAIEFKIG